MSQKKFIIIFGGAFNPITNAHLTLAEHITNEFDVEKVIFMPVGDLYAKKGLISSQHRLNMLREVVASNDKFEVSTIEIDSTKIMRTYDTLNTIKSMYPEYNIAFLMGTDNLEDLVKWYRCDELVSNFYFMVVTRKGDNIEDIISSNNMLKENRNNIIEIKNTVRNDISSSYVRNLMIEGKSPRYYIPEEVFAYIKQNKLYSK